MTPALLRSVWHLAVVAFGVGLALSQVLSVPRPLRRLWRWWFGFERTCHGCGQVHVSPLALCRVCDPRYRASALGPHDEWYCATRERASLVPGVRS